MSVKTIADLKALFERGDTLTETSFVDLIDTLNVSLPSNKRVVSGALRRRVGGNWEAIDDIDHNPLNITGVNENGSVITVNYNVGANVVVSLLVGPDETFVGNYFFGASVGVSSATITIKKLEKKKVKALLTHTGSGNISISSQDGVTGAVLNGSTNELTITHSSCASLVHKFKDMPQFFETEGTVYAPSSYSDSNTETKVRLLNYDGSAKTLGNPEWKRCRFEREITYTDIETGSVNPTTIESNTGNIWLIGIMEINE